MKYFFKYANVHLLKNRFSTVQLEFPNKSKQIDFSLKSLLFYIYIPHLLRVWNITKDQPRFFIEIFTVSQIYTTSTQSMKNNKRPTFLSKLESRIHNPQSVSRPVQFSFWVFISISPTIYTNTMCFWLSFYKNTMIFTPFPCPIW